jgi:hydrogenase maturation protease
VFFGDDGFGVALADRLASEALPPGVRVVDFGISALHLAFEADGCDALVLLDAAPLDEPPGTLTVLRVDLATPPDVLLDAHSISPSTVLAALRQVGGAVGEVLVVACQPAAVDPGVGLTPAVEAAIEAAVPLVLDVVASLASGRS